MPTGLKVAKSAVSVGFTLAFAAMDNVIVGMHRVSGVGRGSSKWAGAGERASVIISVEEQHIVRRWVLGSRPTHMVLAYCDGYSTPMSSYS